MRKGFAKLIVLLFNKRKENKGNQSSFLFGCAKLSQFPDHFSTLESHSPETYFRPLHAMLNYPVYVQRLYNGMNIPNRTDFIGNNKYKDATCCFFSYPEPETSVRQIGEKNCIRTMNK